MTINDAINSLKPFSSKAPTEALAYVRAHWDAAEPILIKAIEQKTADPATEDESALFTYAIHLCAEMRSAKVFPYFVQIARLPNLLLDNMLGDILTETFPQMLALTCHGRINEIKALVEDPTLNDFARGSAMRALAGLLVDGELDQETLSAYCIELLSEKLERQASNAWDTVIDTACEIKAPDALPLIKAAYQRGLADPGMADLAYVVAKYERPGGVDLSQIRKKLRPFRSTEVEMSFFRSAWNSDEDDYNVEELLDILNEQEQVSLSPGESRPSVGRNEPCPCGSGKKYKKCCFDKPVATSALPRRSIHGNPIRNEHLIASKWMEAGYRHLHNGIRWRADECWRHCWVELLCILPATLLDPRTAEDTEAFEGYEFLANWLHDYKMLLVEMAEHNLGVAKFAVEFLERVTTRFPGLPSEMKEDIQADRARCFGMLGEWDKAVDIFENMIKQHPENAKGYVELANFYCFEASLFNRCPDFERAKQYLQDALNHADDCPDYDVTARLEGINAMEAAMRRPLL